MSDKILDCSKLSDYEYEAIKRGFDKFMHPKTPTFFGSVEKRDLKDMCRVLGYTDKRSFVKGGVITAGFIWACSKIKKYIDGKKAEPVEELVLNEEES